MKRITGVLKMAGPRNMVLLRVVVLLAWCVPLGAQIPGLTPAAPPVVAQPSVSADPLGRENPRGCILGFIKAAQEERYSVAVQYFQPATGRHRADAEEEEELASQLLTVMNQQYVGPLDFVSRDPLGRLDDGLPVDQEKISGPFETKGSFSILLVRQDDERGQKLWYISRATLAQVPKAYDSLTFPEVEKKIPDYLVEHRFLYMPLWQWIAILVFIPVALVGARLLTEGGELLLVLWRKSRKLPQLARAPLSKVGPGTLVFAVLIHYALTGYIGTSLLYRLYYRRVIWTLLTIGFYWILTRITRALSSRIGRSLTSRGMYAERSIVALIRRFVEVSILIVLGLIVLHNVGFNVSAALAGLGIGTLALGLGAQKTFENMFGGVSVLFDKVIQIGDTCKVNNQTGVVEDIGLRSTRLRTADRTLLSIPNGIMASSTLENFRFRDKYLCQQVLRLRYDLAPDHVRSVLEEIRGLLNANAKVEDASARVRFLRFAEYALEIEVYCYILDRDYNAYLETQEALLLEIMGALEKTGAVVALPSQATLVSKDAWIDAEKAKAAQAAINKRGGSGGAG
jgi:MscS family membrane protein